LVPSLLCLFLLLNLSLTAEAAKPDTKSLAPVAPPSQCSLACWHNIMPGFAAGAISDGWAPQAGGLLSFLIAPGVWAWGMAH